MAESGAAMATTPDVSDILATLERLGTRRNREGMARYGIVAPKVFGVPMSSLREMCKRLGRDHDLARALWKTGWHEARLMASLVGDPARLTSAEMNRWARDFNNWAVCDTVCFHLFDRSSRAWTKVHEWSDRKEEYVRRAAFALLAGLALHDKTSVDEPFRRAFGLIERAADDDRNFVKKAVSWALRAMGNRSVALHAAALDLARRLADTDTPSARWIGKDVIRDLSRPLVTRRLASREARQRPRRRAAVRP